MTKLLALFVIVPIIELGLLIELGRHIGTPATVALIFATGVLGAFLARRQSLGVIERLQRELAAGQMPADALIDGALILVAGAVLMTPGVLTDALGFFCLIPAGRRLLKSLVARRFRGLVEAGRATVKEAGMASARHDPTVIDVTPER